MRLRIVDGNLDGFTRVEDKLELLAGLDWDMCLLQKITEESWPHLRSLADEALWSGDHLPELVSPPRCRSTILFRGNWLVHDTGPVPRASVSGRPRDARCSRRYPARHVT